MMFRARVDGLERLAGELEAAIDKAGAEGMDSVDKLVADEATRQHVYQSRTGRLQGRTVPGRTRGRLLARSLKGEVLGDTSYGEFLEEPAYRTKARFAFLLPAFVKKQQEAELQMEIALNEAAIAATR